MRAVLVAALLAGLLQAGCARQEHPSIPSSFADGCMKTVVEAQVQMANEDSVPAIELEEAMGSWCSEHLASLLPEGALEAAGEGVAEGVSQLCGAAAHAFHRGHFADLSEAEAFCHVLNVGAVNEALSSGSADALRSAAQVARHYTTSFLDAVRNERVNLPTSRVPVQPAGAPCVRGLESEGVHRHEAQLRCGLLHDGTIMSILQRRLSDNGEEDPLADRAEDQQAYLSSKSELEDVEAQSRTCAARRQQLRQANRPLKVIRLQDGLCALLDALAAALREQGDLATDAQEKSDAVLEDPDSVRRSKQQAYGQAELAVASARVRAARKRVELARAHVDGKPTKVVLGLERELQALESELDFAEQQLHAQGALLTNDEEAMAVEQALKDSSLTGTQRLELEDQENLLRQMAEELYSYSSEGRDLLRLYRDGQKQLAEDPDDEVLQQRLERLAARLRELNVLGQQRKALSASDPCFPCKARMVQVMEHAAPFAHRLDGGMASYMRHFCFMYLHLKLGDTADTKQLCETFADGVANVTQAGAPRARFMEGYAAPLTDFCRDAGMCAQPEGPEVRGPQTTCEHCASEVIGAANLARTRARADGEDADGVAEAATEAVQAECLDHLQSLGTPVGRAAQLCHSYMHPASGPALFARDGSDASCWKSDLADALSACEAAAACKAKEVATISLHASSNGTDELANTAQQHNFYVMLAESRARAEQAEAEAHHQISRAQEGLKDSVHEAQVANQTVIRTSRELVHEAAKLAAIKKLMAQKDKALEEADDSAEQVRNQQQAMATRKGETEEHREETLQHISDAREEYEALDRGAETLMQARVEERTSDLQDELEELADEITRIKGELQTSPPNEERLTEALAEKERRVDEITSQIADIREEESRRASETRTSKADEITRMEGSVEADADAVTDLGRQIAAMAPQLADKQHEARIARAEHDLAEKEVEQEVAEADTAKANLVRAVDDFIAAEARTAASEQAVADAAEDLSRMSGGEVDAPDAARSRVYLSLKLWVRGTASAEDLSAKERRKGVEGQLARLLDVLDADVDYTTSACPNVAAMLHAQQADAQEEADEEEDTSCTEVHVLAVMDAVDAANAAHKADHQWVQDGSLAACFPRRQETEPVDVWLASQPELRGVGAEGEGEGGADAGHGATGGEDEDEDEDEDEGDDERVPVMPIEVNRCAERVLEARDAERARVDSVTADGDHTELDLRSATRTMCERIGAEHLLPEVVDMRAKCDDFVSRWAALQGSRELEKAEAFCHLLADLAHQHSHRDPALNQGGGVHADDLLPRAPNGLFVEGEETAADMGDKEPESTLKTDPEMTLQEQEHLGATMPHTDDSVDALTQSFINANTHHDDEEEG